jgi:hypothetical protein
VKRAFAALALWIALVPALAGARPSEMPRGVSVPTWSQLDADQRHALARFGPRWDRMPASRRVLLLERHQRWHRWSPEQRRAAREGLRHYREMSPRQRQQMRQSVHALRGMDPGERERLRVVWRSLTPEQRRAWLRAGGPGIAPPPRD